MPRRGPVTPAVILRTQMRAALEHLAPEAMRAIARIAAAGFIATSRIARRAARSRGNLRGIGFAVPVGRPLPDIADHVDEAVVIGWIEPHRRGAREAIVEPALMRKFARPVIGEPPATGRKLIAPGVGPLSQTATCREFPLRFSGQTLASPGRIRLGISQRHMH